MLLESNPTCLAAALFLGTARRLQEKDCPEPTTWGVGRNFGGFNEGCGHGVRFEE